MEFTVKTTFSHASLPNTPFVTETERLNALLVNLHGEGDRSMTRLITDELRHENDEEHQISNRTITYQTQPYVNAHVIRREMTLVGEAPKHVIVHLSRYYMVAGQTAETSTKTSTKPAAKTSTKTTADTSTETSTNPTAEATPSTVSAKEPVGKADTPVLETESIKIPFSQAAAATDYDLISFIVHRGATVNSGHYYAYVREQEHWYKVDDTEVTEDPTDREAKAKVAYLYLYEKRQ